METVSDVCPTGILIDIDLQSKSLSNVYKECERNQALIKNKKEKVIAADTKSSNPWTSNCFLDQSPPRPSPILKMKFFTPKSNLKTPSPKSMKIISREASRIVNQLYSSPMNCSEVMIHDEVFPSVRSFDDACLDEFQVKFKSLSTTDIHEKVDPSDTNRIDLTECSISAVSSCTSKDMASDGTCSETVHQFDIKSEEQDSMSRNAVITKTPENASNQTSHDESCVSDKDEVNIICAVNSDPVIPECLNESSVKFFELDHEVTTHKKMPTVAKDLDFELSLKYSEKNKENISLSNGARQAKYVPRFTNTEKSYISIDPKNTKIKSYIRNESIIENFSQKIIAPKCSILEKKAKENRNLEESVSKKPKAFQKKSDVVPSQSLLYKKDPLCRTGPLLETPVVASSIRRIQSFHAGSSKNAFPVERKFTSTIGSCSKVLKPKMSLNQTSINGNGLTPLQSGKSRYGVSSAANPMRRKSLAFNSNCSLLASDMKAITENGRHSTIKKPVATSSSRHGLVKKLNMPSSLPKFTNDSLPRKLFP